MLDPINDAKRNGVIDTGAGIVQLPDSAIVDGNQQLNDQTGSLLKRLLVPH
ncbi:MAG: hypothetical protein ACLSE8_15680 [Parasutterella sp.]